MAVEIVMPRMGLTMEEGTVIAWLKQENQPVAAGEPLLEIETDKSTVEIESPSSGILRQIIAKPGETVPVGAVIGYLAASGEVGKVKASPAARRIARQLGISLAHVAGSGPGGRIVAWNVADLSEQQTEKPVVKASPLAQKVAADLSVDLERVQPTGQGGRVTRADVERVASATAPQREAQEEGSSLVPFEKTPPTRQQRIMAERMSGSFRNAPHFYLHVEVNASKLTALRLSLLEKTEKRFGFRLTYTDILVKYSAMTLLRHPHVMRQWTEDGLLQPNNADVGIAIDTSDGLIVPVIRGAASSGLAEIARQRLELSERAQAGKLLPQELELGVFTITNLGMFGIDSFDAILNPPQAAILAVGRIKERAVVVDGQIIPAPMMNLSLSVDHRILDGASAARFLGDLVELLETPEMAQI
jgi:pyruvate dehydrogenase E2 component (dihydrolipoamide acetyltransferase)